MRPFAVQIKTVGLAAAVRPRRAASACCRLWVCHLTAYHRTRRERAREAESESTAQLTLRGFVRASLSCRAVLRTNSDVELL